MPRTNKPIVAALAALLFTLPLSLSLACGDEAHVEPTPTPVEMPPEDDRPPPSPTAAPGDPDEAAARRDAPAEYFTCEADSDCAAIEMGACDHCNGGFLEAARTEHVDEIKRRWGDHRDLVACTEIACEEAGVECAEGSCSPIPSQYAD